MLDLSNEPLPALPERASTAHKGDFGRALIVGGSLGMAGAPALAGVACLRSGAGLVSVATPQCIQATTASFNPAIMTRGLADDGHQLTDEAGPMVASWLLESNAGAIGPGLGQSEAIRSIVGMAWTLPLPLVFDADALNAIATLRANGSVAAPSSARVVTPHAGEFARLIGEPLNHPHDDSERRAGAAALACSLGGSETVVVLKGARTVISDRQGFAVNSTGNPGMATGGSGDVLTGMIAALLAQGLSAFDSARLAAHVHGLAGDLAAAKLGKVSLTAPDLIEWLPAAWCRTLASTS